MNRLQGSRWVASACLGVTLAATAAERPRQFRVWGAKAPYRLGSIVGKRGLESVRVPKDYEKIEPNTNTVAPDYPAETKTRGYALFTTHRFEKVYPQTQPFAEEVDEAAKAFATPGEYVALTFSVRAFEPLECVRLAVGPIQGESGALPANHVDVRRVGYLYTTQARKRYSIEPRYLDAFGEYDMIDVPRETTMRFWLTVKLPDDLKPGVYRGVVEVKPANRAVATQDLTLRVLPFTLMKPDPYRDITFSILTNHNDCRYASYGMNVFTENIRKHFADMVEHGLTSTGYFCMQPEVELVNGKIVAHFDRPGAYALYSPDTIMALYRESGLTGPFEYQKGPYQMYQYYLRSIVKKDHYTPEYDNAFQEVMRQTVQHMREKNWPELIFVLGDEPGAHADRIKMHRRAGDLLKAVAPNVRTGNYFNGGWAGVKDWKILKPVTDINCTNFVNREVIDDTRELGFDSLWLYNGTSMGRDPKVERMFYGIQPWKVGAKGVTQYMYQCRAANPYDMFAEERVGKSTVGGSAYFYAYPSSGGPIPTPHWEAIRQGIYDYRYLFTLKHAIARARAAGKTQTADEAQKTLDEITNAFPDDFQTRRKDEIVRSISNEMLDIWRWKAARAIMHLN